MVSSHDATPATPSAGLPWKRWGMLLAAAVGIAVFSALVLIVLPDEAHTHGRRATKPPVTDYTVAENGWLPVSCFEGRSQLTQTEFGHFLTALDNHWRPGYAPMLIEGARFNQFSSIQAFDFLRKKAGEPISLPDTHAVWRWVWQAKAAPHPDYAEFKSKNYRTIDERFANYFANDRPTTIRLEEILWGGVRRDGIPPLKNPKMIAANRASYLDDSNIVFGIEINGDARAYPKRILAWHEMFKDVVGDVSVNGVYCTLCGMLILYETEFDGEHHELGTSGFLYRSNKLMYDHATESLWSTTRGEPVVGPLVGRRIRLKTRPVVTTTWGEWRRRHPDTTVLSLNTGHRRNYGEGAAYASYFATDRLMFPVPELEPVNTVAGSLDNKLEILALRFGDANAPPTAIIVGYLAHHPVFQGEHGGQRYVVLTDSSGANRVYAAAGHDFDNPPTLEGLLMDTSGVNWRVEEDRLVNTAGDELPRLPAHRAFWFGWQAAHPNTKLIGR